MYEIYFEHHAKDRDKVELLLETIQSQYNVETSSDGYLVDSQKYDGTFQIENFDQALEILCLMVSSEYCCRIEFTKQEM